MTAAGDFEAPGGQDQDTLNVELWNALAEADEAVRLGAEAIRDADLALGRVRGLVTTRKDADPLS